MIRARGIGPARALELLVGPPAKLGAIDADSVRDFFASTASHTLWVDSRADALVKAAEALCTDENLSAAIGNFEQQAVDAAWGEACLRHLLAPREAPASTQRCCLGVSLHEERALVAQLLSVELVLHAELARSSARLATDFGMAVEHAYACLINTPHVHTIGQRPPIRARVLQHALSLEPAELRALMRRLDCDGDGVVSLADLRTCLRGLGDARPSTRTSTPRSCAPEARSLWSPAVLQRAISAPCGSISSAHAAYTAKLARSRSAGAAVVELGACGVMCGVGARSMEVQWPPACVRPRQSAPGTEEAASPRAIRDLSRRGGDGRSEGAQDSDESEQSDKFYPLLTSQQDGAHVGRRPWAASCAPRAASVIEMTLCPSSARSPEVLSAASTRRGSACSDAGSDGGGERAKAGLACARKVGPHPAAMGRRWSVSGAGLHSSHVRGMSFSLHAEDKIYEHVGAASCGSGTAVPRRASISGGTVTATARGGYVPGGAAARSDYIAQAANKLEDGRVQRAAGEA